MIKLFLAAIIAAALCGSQAQAGMPIEDLPHFSLPGETASDRFKAETGNQHVKPYSRQTRRAKAK